MPPTGRTTRSARDSPQPYSKTTNSRANSPSTSPAATAHISRSSGLQSLKLTVKAPPSKLRQATTGRAQQLPPNPYTPNSNGEVTGRPTRTTRNPKRVVEEEDSSDEAEEEDGDDGGMMELDEAEVDNELLGMADDDGDSEEDAEGEEDDGMLGTHPPPPIIKQSVGQGGRPSVKVTAPPVTTATGAMKSVEAKEMRMDGSDDDEELSELSEGDEEDIDQTLGPDNDDDEVEEESADDLSDDDEENSRSATPDLSKLTRRQRGLYVPEPEFTASTSDGAGLMALSNEALKKKVFSEEEHAMRRQEMARRRKMLSEKRGEEEKMETINKLLSKPAPKRRTRAEMIAAQYAAEHHTLNGTPNPEDGEMPVERVDAGFTRYVQNARGARLGVPVEWLGVEGGNGVLGVGMGRGVGAGLGLGGMVEEVG
ncbi:hypothetical protein LTR56_010424 [Elasticomyces elasticus]|nr:hypothetical protein LTR56_010424 [Elasticomyces elasticus]KAK3648484.1 hypothetical protein LTR22_013376 [Elasticomyces elasticus]KAK4916793.1 hypothetical protein LTR49_015237 [Elasticomyces elasticus]KAK5755943.1 hypothetical protein LTS12_013947 [Elasticomyces elasticus]